MKVQPLLTANHEKFQKRTTKGLNSLTEKKKRKKEQALFWSQAAVFVWKKKPRMMSAHSRHQQTCFSASHWLDLEQSASAMMLKVTQANALYKGVLGSLLIGCLSATTFTWTESRPKLERRRQLAWMVMHGVAEVSWWFGSDLKIALKSLGNFVVPCYCPKKALIITIRKYRHWRKILSNITPEFSSNAKERFRPCSFYY